MPSEQLHLVTDIISSGARATPTGTVTDSKDFDGECLKEPCFRVSKSVGSNTIACLPDARLMVGVFHCIEGTELIVLPNLVTQALQQISDISFAVVLL